MKPRLALVWRASLFAVLAAADPLSAQPVIELSPFVVNSTKDTGYQAMSTLAGTRLDTPLKDLGAAISIYTKDFIEDIGATNVNELFVYATSMDAAGPGGNYSNSNTLNDINTPVLAWDNMRENPMGATRARGLAAATATRGFFLGMMPIDTYNVERITVLRGPNAALFGIGSPAGVSDTSLLRADLRRDSNKVSNRLDNEMGLRNTVELNRVLIPNKLAVRLAGLQAREEFNQRPAYERKEQLYGTFTYAPFKYTSLRGNFETGRITANREFSGLPVNGVSSDWLAAGRPSFDWAYYDDPARNPNAASQNSGNFYPYYLGQAAALSNYIVIVYNNPDDQRYSYAIRGTTPSTSGSVADSVRTQLYHPSLNRDLSADTLTFTSTREINEFPVAQYWIGGNVLPGQLPNRIPPGLKDQGFTDFSAFDWKNHLVDETGLFKDSFRAFNVALEQRAWKNRLGIEIAFDKQRLYRSSFTSFISGTSLNNKVIRVDTTVTLPNGLPNPNLGRPFIQAGSLRWQNTHNDAQTARVSGYLKYDFAEEGRSWSRWLGRHLLSGIIDRYEKEAISFQLTPRTDGPYARTTTSSINARIPGFVVYLGPSVIGNNNPVKINPIKIPTFSMGPVGDVMYFKRAADATDVGNFTTDRLELALGTNGGALQRQVIKSKGFILQSNWLDDHIVTVGGWRSDASYDMTGSTAFVLNSANPNDLGKVIYGFDDIDFPRTPPLTQEKETKSFSVVLRWPQKLFKLPKGVDFSAFYNDSENFTPTAGQPHYSSGIPRPTPIGTTKEYGGNFSAFDDKLTLRVNRFETGSKFALFNPVPAYTNTSVWAINQVLTWSTEANTNPDPTIVARTNADIAKLVAAMPAGYLEYWGYQVTGTAPNLVATRTNSPLGLGDTASINATGAEYELIYNPTANWRILANVARFKTVRSDMIPGTKEIIGRLTPVVQELAGRSSAHYPEGYKIGDPLPTGYTTLAQSWDTNVITPVTEVLTNEGFPTPEQRRMRINLVTSYRFGPGSIFGEKLKGWTVGGGYRWQDVYIMGYPSRRLANGLPVFDMAHPWTAPTETNIDAFVSYGRKVWNNRIDWKLQLNATNIYTERALIPIAVQPWGQPAAVRLAPQQRWYLTSTFSF